MKTAPFALVIVVALAVTGILVARILMGDPEDGFKAMSGHQEVTAEDLEDIVELSRKGDRITENILANVRLDEESRKKLEEMNRRTTEDRKRLEEKIRAMRAEK